MKRIVDRKKKAGKSSLFLFVIPYNKKTYFNPR